MKRDISGCWDDTGTLRGTPQREAVPLTKLEDVRDVAAIRDQARITVQRQYDLLICKREIIIVVPDAGYSKHGRLGCAQSQLRPLHRIRGPGCLRNRYSMRHNQPPRV